MLIWIIIDNKYLILLISMFAILFSIFTVIVFSSTGHFFLKKTDVKNYPALDSFLLSFGLGYGIYGTLVFFLGLFGLLKVECLLVLIFFGVVLSIVYISYFENLILSTYRFIKNFDKNLLLRFLLGTVVIFLIINTFIALAPITSMDALNYHFSLPKEYLSAGKIVSTEGYLYSHLPQLSEMINALMMGLGSDIAGAVLNSFFAIFCTCLIFSVVRKFFDKKLACISASLFCCSSLLTWVATGNFVEPHLTYFVLLSLYSLLLFLEKKSKILLVLSGIFLGICILN